MANVLEDMLKVVDEFKQMLSSTMNSPALSGFKQGIDAADDSLGKLYDDYKGLILPVLGLVAVESNSLSRAFAQVGSTGTGAITDLGDGLTVVRDLLSSISPVLGTMSGAIINQVNRFDSVLSPVRSLETLAISVGTKFGDSFNNMHDSVGLFAHSLEIAKNGTYELMNASKTRGDKDFLSGYFGAVSNLSNAGLGVKDITKDFMVGSEAMNIWRSTLILSRETGIELGTTAEMIANSIRKMNLTVEDSSRPFIELQNLSRSTQIPIDELKRTIYDTALANTRLGLSVDGITPIVERFATALGPGRIGYAAADSEKFVTGLVNKINTAQGAFIAMQGGLSKVGASVGEVMLDFEAAMEKPEQLVGPMAKILGQLGGGKVITFEMARENSELANSFKMQRDQLNELIGVSDPKDQRDILKMLSNFQNGTISARDAQVTMADAIKNNSDKNEAQRTLQEKLGKASVDLLYTIAYNTAVTMQKALPSSTISSVIDDFHKSMQDGLNNQMPGMQRGADELLEKMHTTTNTVVNGIRAIPGMFGITPNPTGTGPTAQVMPSTPPASATAMGEATNPLNNIKVALNIPAHMGDNDIVTVKQLRAALVEFSTGVG